MKTKNQNQSENKNWKILVSFWNQLIIFNKNLQNDIEAKIIKVGINKNPIILKNKVNHKDPGLLFKVKNKIDKINNCNKKYPNIFNGVNTTFFVQEI